MKPIITWIVIADGDTAKVFANDGPGKGMKPVEGLAFEQAHLRAREIMADKQGRSFSSFGPGSRSAIDYKTDPVEVRERRFVEHLADVLDERLTAGAFQRLIIAAAPSALGDIRPALSDAVKRTILAELPKDLVKTPSAKLAEHFDGLLAL
jgi:protein required for attachment to host cells